MFGRSVHHTVVQYHTLLTYVSHFRYFRALFNSSQTLFQHYNMIMQIVQTIYLHLHLILSIVQMVL